MATKDRVERLALCQALANAGAAPTWKARRPPGLLHDALKLPERLPLVRALLALGDDPNALSPAGASPLRLALNGKADSLALVQELLSGGARLSSLRVPLALQEDYRQDRSSPSLLALALQAPRDALGLTEALLAAGADLCALLSAASDRDSLDFKSRFALEVAHPLRNQALTQALLNAGAKPLDRKLALGAPSKKIDASSIATPPLGANGCYGNEHGFLEPDGPAEPSAAPALPPPAPPSRPEAVTIKPRALRPGPRR